MSEYMTIHTPAAVADRGGTYTDGVCEYDVPRTPPAQVDEFVKIPEMRIDPGKQSRSRIHWSFVLLPPIVQLGILLSGCPARQNAPAQTLPPTGRPRQSSTLRVQSVIPGIKREIFTFLQKPQVAAILGFNPVKRKIPITITVSEQSVLMGQGIAYSDKQIWISGYLFTTTDPEIEMIRQGFSKERYGERLDAIKALRNNPKLLRLYRGLLLVHELGHVKEQMSKPYVSATGHGVINRIEYRLLVKLYRARQVSLSLARQVVQYLFRYQNSEGENFDKIKRTFIRDFSARLE